MTLLWALRSPCNLGCRYCYFGTVGDHRLQPVTQTGRLSHLARTDLSADRVMAFARTLEGSAVRRVFVAGGEPLIWPPVLELLAILKAASVQVIVCTNGIPLNRSNIRTGLLDLGVDAVSVSLDSADAAYNDAWRPSHNSKDGWRQVIEGITALRDSRGRRPSPRIGIYTVLTRHNAADLLDVARLACDLECDYFVPQPIALDGDHALHDELSLTRADVSSLRAAFTELQQAQLPLRLPAAPYADQVTAAVSHPTGVIEGCFGGSTLNFIEPDGSVWDCPSSLRIAATPPERRRNIRGADARTLFAARGCTDCSLFSVDCVNMWPLMGFDRFLASNRPNQDAE
ncbi:radical SAM protein [Actinomadura sp. KC06]|uniref:radical SAM protein n=1 Tax=Actinomadura sp. KC06 TaxID=2530369 RepID=UPI001FB842EA|nr:radical SAM protein [Actinomadura sp. KC06]